LQGNERFNPFKKKLTDPKFISRGYPPNIFSFGVKSNLAVLSMQKKFRRGFSGTHKIIK
jgi:hypothetical protein